MGNKCFKNFKKCCKSTCYVCPCCCTISVSNEELPLIQNESPREIIQSKNIINDNGIMLSIGTIQINDNYKTFMNENNENKINDNNKDNVNENNKHFSNNDNEKKDKIRIVTISDIHMKHDSYQMPKGDILIIAGDFTNWTSSFHDYPLFKEWLKKLHSLQLYSHQILVSGNHDLCLNDIYNHPRRYLQKQKHKKNNNNVNNFNDKDNNGIKIIEEELWNECHTIYLHDRSIQLYGLTFYGTPYHIKRGCLFQANAFGKNINEFNSIIKQIPKDVDILITHFPPYGVGDFANGLHIGSDVLLNEIKNRIKPIMHIFGHIHQSLGIYFVENCSTTFVNTALKPRIFEIMIPKKHILQPNNINQ